MIFGSIQVEDGVLITHRDSFILKDLSVVSVRRPYLAGAVLISSGIAGFALGFADLLYQQEMMGLAGAALVCLCLGTGIGQLSLLSRDLKGTELSSAVWGTPGALQRARRFIVARRRQSLAVEGFDGSRDG